MTGYSCPSAPPDAEGARVFGVVLGDAENPRVAYLEKRVLVPPQTLDALDGVSPTRVFRFSGKCVEGACAQFKDGACRLGQQVLRRLGPAADQTPACTVRATCRWFAENGAEVCLRCPRVVTTAIDDPVLRPLGEPA